VIASCSEEDGIELLHIFNQAITNKEFIKYLRYLKRKNRQRIALFCDQLSVHRSKEVKVVYEELDIRPIYNVGYSPEYNPIESVFSQVKRTYNRERLNKLANGEIFDQTDQIRRSFKKITKQVIAACVKKSMN
jgi:transposase